MRETVKTQKPVLTILILFLIFSALSTSAARADGRSYSSEDAVILAKLVWGEARGLDATQQAAVVWCVLNQSISSTIPIWSRTTITKSTARIIQPGMVGASTNLAMWLILARSAWTN